MGDSAPFRLDFRYEAGFHLDAASAEPRPWSLHQECRGSKTYNTQNLRAALSSSSVTSRYGSNSDSALLFCWRPIMSPIPLLEAG